MAEQLNLELAIDPDTAAMEEAIAGLGDSLDRVYKEAKKGAQPWADVQSKAIEDAVKGLARQREELTKIKTLNDPSLLKEQVALELKMEEALRNRSRLMEQERARQQGGGIVGVAGRGVGGILSGAGDVAAGAVGSLSKPLGPLSSIFEGTGKIIGGVGDKMMQMGGAAGAAGAVFKGLSVALDKVLGTVGTLVQAMATASPAVFEQLQYVLTDIVGVVGSTVTPVFQALIPVIRLLGDAIATVLPSGEEMTQIMDLMQPAFHELSTVFREVVSELGPLIRGAYLDWFKDLAGVFNLVARAVADFTRTVMGLLATLGLTATAQGVEPGMRSSTGAAARRASISSTDSYQQQLQTAAFAIPGRTDPVANINTNVGLITGLLTNIFTGISNVWNTLVGFGAAVVGTLTPIFQGIWDVVKDVHDTIVDTVGSVLSDIWEEIQATGLALEEAFSPIMNLISQGIAGLTGWFAQTALPVFQSILDGANSIFNSLTETLAPAFLIVRDAVTGVWNSILVRLNNVWTTLGQIYAWIQTALNQLRPSEVVNNVSESIDNIVQSYQQTGPQWLDIPDPLRIRELIRRGGG